MTTQGRFASAHKHVCPLTVEGFDLPGNWNGVSVTVDKGMQILEEMQREEREKVEREEAAKLDETETTGADNAS